MEFQLSKPFWQNKPKGTWIGLLFGTVIHYINGDSHQKIADDLDMKKGAVQWALSRIVEKLKGLLK